MSDVDARARARASELGVELAMRIGEEVPGVRATAADGVVTIEGRGLRRRLASEPALGWIGGMLR